MAKRETIGFLGQVFDDASAAATVVLAALGDRLGLFEALDDDRARSAQELGDEVGLDPRYVTEWADALVAAGYLALGEPGAALGEPGAALGEPGAERRYVLPAAHRPVLTGSGPYAMGGMLEQFLGMTAVVDDVAAAFVTGAGVPAERYPASVFDGMARVTGAAHDHALVPRWLPTVPGLVDALQAGCRVADIGCGQGRALLAMAAAFPASTFVGFDAFAPQVDAARRRAVEAGVEDRVRFELHDASQPLPEDHGRFDLVCAFDVLHDAADPAAVATTIAGALSEDGVALLLEPNGAPGAEPAPTEPGRPGPRDAVRAFYGATSVLYCLSVSKAAGGPGLGTLGLQDQAIADLCRRVGLADPVEAPIGNLFNRLWVARRR